MLKFIVVSLLLSGCAVTQERYERDQIDFDRRIRAIESKVAGNSNDAIRLEKEKAPAWQLDELIQDLEEGKYLQFPK